MGAPGWYTKQDMLNDLASITGITSDSDYFIVRGEKPPPPRLDHEEDDTEFQLRFGNKGHKTCCNAVEPDLAGITTMLRMIDKCDTAENDLNSINGIDDPPNIKLVVSKLNPTVKEFVPKILHESKELNSNNPNDETNEGISDGNCDEKSDNSTTKVDDEKVRKAAILKEKIIEASKQNSMKHKTERNVAIAGLIKLHSTPVTVSPDHKQSISNSPNLFTENPFNPVTQDPLQVSSSCSSPKPLLFTPEYYEKLPNAVKTVREEEIERQKQIPIVAAPEIATPMATVMAESITKVNDWLNGPKKETIKPFVPFKGTELFKLSGKKKGASPKSPEFSSSSTISSTTPSFVPSSIASELVKKYQENNRNREKITVDIWSKLENDLKAKDKEARRKQREKELNDCFNVSESTNCNRS